MFLALGAALLLLGGGIGTATVLGATASSPPAGPTVTVDVGTGAQGEQGPPGPPGGCPDTYTPSYLVIVNHPGGHITVFTCILNSDLPPTTTG